eukprot:Amastigsp_a842106_57.p3 type:complete len:105 gc:universal Amastigsp_a842106_57:249-563(+)
MMGRMARSSAVGGAGFTRGASAAAVQQKCFSRTTQKVTMAVTKENARTMYMPANDCRLSCCCVNFCVGTNLRSNHWSRRYVKKLFSFISSTTASIFDESSKSLW